MRTAITIATLDPTDAEGDLIAEAITNAVIEVYPTDVDPLWVNPAGAVVIDRDVLTLILDAAVIGLEGSEEDRVEEAWDAVQTLRANLPA